MEKVRHGHAPEAVATFSEQSQVSISLTIIFNEHQCHHLGCKKALQTHHQITTTLAPTRTFQIDHSGEMEKQIGKVARTGIFDL